MNGVWGVRGVREEARREAKEAAAAAGKRLGEWIEGAIGLKAEREEQSRERERAGSREKKAGKAGKAGEGGQASEVGDSGEHHARGTHGGEACALCDIPQAETKVKRCVHGIKKGVNCWQCGGLASVR